MVIGMRQPTAVFISVVADDPYYVQALVWFRLSSFVHALTAELLVLRHSYLRGAHPFLVGADEEGPVNAIRSNLEAQLVR